MPITNIIKCECELPLVEVMTVESETESTVVIANCPDCQEETLPRTLPGKFPFFAGIIAQKPKEKNTFIYAKKAAGSSNRWNIRVALH